MFIYGNNKIIVKNLIHIYKIDESNITLKTKDKIVKIQGDNLEVNYLEYGEIHVLGNINEIKFNEK